MNNKPVIGVFELKKLHDLLVLKITQGDEERKKLPLAQIVGRAGIKWEPEFPVDKGWIDIYIPIQEGIEQPYVIEVQTGYDFNCSGILQKLERFRKTMPKEHKPEVATTRGGGLVIASTPIPLKLCVVIPPDFAEFLPLFKPKEISVFLWKGTLKWKCKECGKITSMFGPWKPMKCSSCNKPNRSLSLVDLRDFEIKKTEV